MSDQRISNEGGNDDSALARAEGMLKNASATREELQSQLFQLLKIARRYRDSAAPAERQSERESDQKGIRKIQVARGVHWVEIPAADLRILCGCPADSVKLLARRGLILNTERDGVSFETGPNAILLSEVMIQNGQIANLAEFPVLQMLYRQGMILPNHPGNTGAKPMLIGLPAILKAQSEYIYRGNYGLTTTDEMVSAGVSEREANELMRLKLRFAFGRIRSTDELIDLRAIDGDVTRLADEVFLHRTGLNRYEFIWNGQSAEVDLNLAPGEEYESAYVLGAHEISKEYFSVVHVGEGDGWDVNRPCMGSLVTYQGRLYLIDAGPKILNSLTALGISIGEIEGIFHTHAHDDHFAGIASMIRSDRRLKYYATAWVRKSVEKKLAALMSIDEASFSDYFEPIDLEFDRWNNIEGLEVMPILSPHPIETNVLFFRTQWESGYRSYAHLADICSLDVLRKMITDDPRENGIREEFFDRTRRLYLTHADLKKIDIGGGLIHGEAEDFADDTSERILLAHTEHPLTSSQRVIGSNAGFGLQDVLIASIQDTTKQDALKYLAAYFPEVPRFELEMLANYPIVPHNAGTILVRKGVKHDSVHLLVRGSAEYIDEESAMANRLSAGSFMGEISGLSGGPSPGTYRAVSYVTALAIPGRHYIDFVDRNGLRRSLEDLHARREFLRRSWFFNEAVTYPVQNRIAKAMTRISLQKGKLVEPSQEQGLLMVATGRIDLRAGGQFIDYLSAGEFCGEDCFLLSGAPLFSAVVTEATTAYSIPCEIVKEIPIVRWKLLESLNRRIRKLSRAVSLEWSDDYMIGIPAIDGQHRDLFERARGLYESFGSGGISVEFQRTFVGLGKAVAAHFEAEENLLGQIDYPHLEDHRKSHAQWRDHIARIARQIESGRTGGALPDDFGDGLLHLIQDWFVRHLLLEDGKYRGYKSELTELASSL